ncbi:hypothetical protein EJ05DRAFT_487308 [Pseudovirgaria hyperparasitica]|uniref:MFS general substrate transporter n=1 Tax=Pseudovirgaria hyperparasitica TaxID=470096 RepID=A0A6A6W0F5_9PEZI|nr:uncharacterized protein EJ05DRAFT_487308 [Pseudovirgaria hyperparasitica]KAF2756398.1 hypothetical protein EJ05DRAFT_487308 [Pseudovirgaria hyperparasitica]
MLAISFTASRTQVLTYLLCIALFSISFLVFLNASISFVITERIGDREKVGNAVGTLGFADELVALVACPLWGVLSDRIGVRAVAVMGYAIVGCSLYVLVQAKNVYPQLLLARIFFSLGGAATMTYIVQPTPDTRSHSRSPAQRHNVTPSISSELTITPARWRSTSPSTPSQSDNDSGASTSRLAGLVGMFTGCGALIALLLFLPLPTTFQEAGKSRAEAVADSFYVVGAVAFAVAIGCFIGLRHLPGEDTKSMRKIWQHKTHKDDIYSHSSISAPPVLSYAQQLLSALRLGFQDRNIGLGYLGGFVARASSVAISLFIPLFCNAYFISTGKCPPSDTPPEALPPDLKDNCRRAYILAATLTGSSQLVALICAPIFGYFSAKYSNRFNIPLLVSSMTGIAGYVSFALVKSPDPKSEDGSGGIYFVAALLGISQIGAIVCSLGLLGRGIHGEAGGARSNSSNDVNGYREAPSYPNSASHTRPSSSGANPNGASLTTARNSRDFEAAPLLPTDPPSYDPEPTSRTHLKGSIAGIYSLLGGAAILLLTKLGGWLFDDVAKGGPFWMMAVFNAALAVGAVGVGLRGWFAKGRDE